MIDENTSRYVTFDVNIAQDGIIPNNALAVSNPFDLSIADIPPSSLEAQSKLTWC